MKIAILTLHNTFYSKTRYYNGQDIGLGMALTKNGNHVHIFRLCHNLTEVMLDNFENNLIMSSVPSKKIGFHSICKMNFITEIPDVMICFSDNQLMFPTVYRWAMKNHVSLFPYIGISESHSNNLLIRRVTDGILQHDLYYYRKCTVFAKTEAVKSYLLQKGVHNTKKLPIGLNNEFLYEDYRNVDRIEIAKSFGFSEKDRILLFIGRLEPEKEPLELLHYFKERVASIDDIKLLMIGDGYLYEETEKTIHDLNLQDRVHLIKKIVNKDIWRCYCCADWFINMNKQEIFGMSILEAMYYECVVIAHRAPGPNEIIDDGVNGYLFDDIDDIYDIFSMSEIESFGKAAHLHISKHFMWDVIVNDILFKTI